jgi:ubiquinone/menaquinone biosynthesis C-methylase UbiE
MSNVDKNESQDSYYVCPVCRQPLTPTANGLSCKRDGIEYPVKNGIVDFVTDLKKSTNLLLKSTDIIDNIAKIYEGPYYGTVQMINAELGIPSMEEMAKMITEMVDAENGAGLDVACGTGFFTRSIAEKMRLVYGIDISMGMLEQATDYVREREIGNIRFARSRVKKLLFPDGVFDGVTCSRGLHKFPDTMEALSEMARVMKSGARLAVMTVVTQGLSTLKTIFEREISNPLVKELLVAFDVKELEKYLSRIDVEELEKYLSQTGFKGFTYTLYGYFMLFQAEKTDSN